jgi:hypothetical protein
MGSKKGSLFVLRSFFTALCGKRRHGGAIDALAVQYGMNAQWIIVQSSIIESKK